MQNAPLPPFRAGAARHRTTTYTYTYTPGVPIQIPLNRQGYLADLKIKFEGTVTVGTAGTVTDPYATVNFFPLIGLRSPQGDYLISLSSRSLYNFQHRFKLAQLDAIPHGATQVGNIRPGAATFDPSSQTAQAVDVSYTLPISLNLGSSFDVGLLLAQVANNDFYLSLSCASAGDLVGAGSCVITSIAGTIYIEATWFELVDPTQIAAPNLHSVCRLRDSINSNLVIGDNYLSYQLGPVLMDQMLLLQTNVVGDSSSGGNFNYIKLLANRQIEMENRRGKDIYRDNFHELGKQLPPGVFLLNFMDDYDLPNVTRGRDFVNSNLAAQLDTVVNIAPGTTLSGAQATSIYRELITLGA